MHVANKHIRLVKKGQLAKDLQEGVLEDMLEKEEPGSENDNGGEVSGLLGSECAGHPNLDLEEHSDKKTEMDVGIYSPVESPESSSSLESVEHHEILEQLHEGILGKNKLIALEWIVPRGGLLSKR